MTTDPEPPSVVSSRVVHDGFLRVHVDTLRYASGREGTIDVIDHPGGVTLIAFDDQERLLLVRQYRHPAGRALLELPAGTLDPGETPEACAERELQEETGFRPAQLERLGGFYLAPGYCAEYQHVFLAGGLTASRLQGDEDAIDLVPMALGEALRLCASGGIVDAKTIAALLLYVQREGLFSHR